MFNLRDYKLKQQQQQASKADAKPRYRAVITASDGSRTDGSPWADEDAKQVWHQRFGSGGLGRAWCKAIVPEVGLGVIVSPTDDKLGWEVVESDPFLRRTATDPRNYETIAPEDLQPGGRLLLWVDSRQITPLATYETTGTLLINVASGDYAYLGVRKTFAGAVGQDLSSYVPGGGLTRYVGLYIDSTNTLNFIAGGTVAIGATPPEPAWPDGAFQLSVVQLDNGQTAIDFADDIFDRRMAWTDTVSSFTTWPRPGKINIGTTEYDTIADAGAALASGDLFKFGEGTFSTSTSFDFNGTPADLLGSGMDVSFVDTTDANGAIYFGPGTIKDLTFQTTVASGIAVELTGATIAINCKFTAAATGTIKAVDIWDACTLLSCLISATGATTNYGVYVHGSAGTTTIYGGEIIGDIFVDTGSTLRLEGPQWNGVKTGGGTLTGWWFDGNLQPTPSTEIWFFAR